jgi:gamma-glutamyltranspeptidase/glutathione hydrolase|tara:strand:- start:1220 stop:2851 length:1632 start_codon:yes stop_codon:yes gene_type:complete
MILLLTACSSNPFESLNPFKTKEDEGKRGTIGFVIGFLGGVATDEPRATLVGRDILSSGGTAADAAVAVMMALSVTLPSSASLGGGGVCVVHDSKTNTTESLDFRSAVPKNIPATATLPTAVPGLVRGMAMLHSKYGRLAWANLVSPAETLARFGNQVSRAFAQDLKQIPPVLLADPEIRKIFSLGKGGRFIQEGDFLKQLELSSVLSRLRVRGAGDFYTGLLGRQLVAAVARAGGSLTLNDLRAYAPRWRPTLKISYIQNTKFHFPGSAITSGVLAAQIIGMLAENGDWEDSSPAEREHLMAEVIGIAYAGRGRWLRNDGSLAVDPASLVSEDSLENLISGFKPERHVSFGNSGASPGGDPGSSTGTGFVIVDREGSAVACSLTLNNPFGTGKVARGMGVLLGALPGPLGRGPDSLAVMLLINNVHNIFYFGLASSGGAVAPSVLAGVATRTLMGRKKETLEIALAAKRLYNSGNPDLTYYEQGMDTSIIDDLSKRGHRLSPVPAMGKVNGVFCSTGVPNKEDLSCSMRPDPRGFGLAAGAE